MILDMHMHIYPCEQALAEGVADHMAADEVLGVIAGAAEKALVISLPRSPKCDNALYRQNNKSVAATIAGRKALNAVCSVNVQDPPAAMAELKNCIETLGFVGLKIHPNTQRIYPNDSSLFPLYEQMSRYGLPVLFHCGGIGITPKQDKYGDPVYVDDVACAFPQLPIIMAHGGRGHYTVAAMLARKHENVYADVGANFSKLKGGEHILMRRLVSEFKIWTGSVDKLLLGSDHPFYSTEKTLETLRACCGKTAEGVEILDEDIERIINENAGAFCKKYGLFY